tara:strand:- start:17 stop:193 length:177 start_codon:yes stop_codon:yes gene_type:complete
MATKYKLYPKESNGREVPAIQRTLDDGTITSIPTDPANTDYAEYLEWVAKGNTAEAAD